MDRTEKHWESKWKAESDDYWEDLIQNWRSGWALVREWIAEPGKPRKEHQVKKRDCEIPGSSGILEAKDSGDGTEVHDGHAGTCSND